MFQLTNLYTQKQVCFELEENSSASFHDNKMIVATRMQALREAVVDEVFEEPSVNTLRNSE